MSATFTIQDTHTIDFKLVDEDGQAVNISGKALATGIALKESPDPTDSNDWLILNAAKHTNLDVDASTRGTYRLTLSASDVSTLALLDQPEMFLIVDGSSGTTQNTHWSVFPFKIKARPAVVVA